MITFMVIAKFGGRNYNLQGSNWVWVADMNVQSIVKSIMLIKVVIYYIYVHTNVYNTLVSVNKNWKCEQCCYSQCSWSAHKTDHRLIWMVLKMILPK